jgi:hypothetical protein
MTSRARDGIVYVPDYLAPVNVTRSTSGAGDPVLAAPAETEYYVLDCTQLENRGTSAVVGIIKSGTRVLWERQMVAQGDGLLLDKPLDCDAGAAVYVDLSADVAVKVQMLVYKVQG